MEIEVGSEWVSKSRKNQKVRIERIETIVHYVSEDDEHYHCNEKLFKAMYDKESNKQKGEE